MLLVCSSLASGAMAAASDHRLGGALRFSSDYAYRGYTRSNNDWTIQANLDYEHSSGFFAGAWASKVDFTQMDIDHEGFEDRRRAAGIDVAEEDFSADNRAEIEITPYMGWNWTLNENWRVHQIISGYIYDGEVLGSNYDYYELYTQVHYRDLVSARIGVAPAAYGYAKTGVNFELQGRYPINDVVEVWGSLGYDTVTAVPDFSQLYWNIGVKWYVQKHIALELRYTDAAAFADGSTSALLGPPQPVQADPIIASISIGF
jgi:hypothetical protein